MSGEAVVLAEDLAQSINKKNQITAPDDCVEMTFLARLQRGMHSMLYARDADGEAMRELISVHGQRSPKMFTILDSNIQTAVIVTTTVQITLGKHGG